MKKNVLEIIGGILVLVFVAVLVVIVIVNKDDKSDSSVKEEYKILKNSNIKFKYVSSYDEYLDFMDAEEISKNDYYESMKESDFKDSTYLVIAIPFDECSESFKNDELVRDGKTYKLYLDMEYSCGVCPLVYKVLSYKVDKADLDLNIYTKTISKEECDPNVSYKPIIYIYPDEDMDLTITLGNPDNLLYTYPKYNNNWYVHVTTDGNIYDYNTNRNYYGLYWEGYDNYKLDLKEGFVVKGSETISFLEEKLAILGLNDYEINEFIIYWIDKLENNNYNFISFRSQEDINKSMPLNLSEEPDTLIRVMMDYKPLDNYIEVKEQPLTKVERKGFTIVEWGGTKH